MVKVYSLDQLNQVVLFFCHAAFSLSTRFKLYVIASVSLLKVSFEGFPPLSATLASGVKYNTLPCRSSINPHQDFISNLTMTLLRVSPAPAPRSILVKKVTFQRREGETSSGSRLEITFRLSIQFFSTVEAALVRVSQAIWTWPV